MRKKIEQTFTDAGLTGRLKHNSTRINQRAIKKMLDGDPYWSLNLDSLETGDLEYQQALKVLANSLGVSSTEFKVRSHAYIDPEATLSQLRLAMTDLTAAARSHQTILFATGHPGSLIGFYAVIADYLASHGATIFQLPEPIELANYYWLDSVGSVIVISDEGSLLHTHEGYGLNKILEHHNVDWVVADHGFAATAVNAGINTAAFFDTDDPAIPMAAARNPKLIAVPMNDNSKNCASAHAIAQLLRHLDD